MDTENLTHGKESGSKQQLLPTIIAVVALAVALFAIAAPQGGQAAPAASDDSFGRIVQEGKITACYVVWPPSVIKDPNTGQLSGFVIDIFEKIADDAKLQVNYVESTWGGFPADLNAGKCDVAVAGIYPLISRSIAVSFTKPYLYAGSSAVVRSEDTRFKTLEDLNQEGVRVAAVQGEYGHLYAQKYLPKATLVILEKDASPTMPHAAVSSGQADVGFSMADVVAAMQKTTPKCATFSLFTRSRRIRLRLL